MNETGTDTNSREPFRSGVYVRTALYVLLVASGVFAALQAHQYLNRKQHPEDELPTAGRYDAAADADDDEGVALLADLPVGETSMTPVQALPPVDAPVGAKLWFAMGRPSLEPGHVQLLWLYRGEFIAADIEQHYRQRFQQAGYAFRGDRDAADRRALVFTRNGDLAVLTLRNLDDDETIERFIVTLNRPARDGDFFAKPAKPATPAIPATRPATK